MDELLEKAKALVSAKKFPIPVQPAIVLPFPQNPSKLSEEQLSQQLSYWSSWVGYSGFCASAIDAEFIRVKSRLEFEIALAFTNSKIPKTTDKRKYVDSRAEIRVLTRKSAQLEADLKVIQSLCHDYELKYAAISRELSRRTNEAQANRR